MRTQPSPFDIGTAGAPLGQLRAKAGTFAARAALIVRLPFRKDVGINNLSWDTVVIVTLAMLALNWWFNVHISLGLLFGGGVYYDGNTALRNFAFAWAALASFEHFKRLDEERQGRAPHTFFPGTSRFDLTFLPFSPKVIALGVEPGIAFLSGAVLRRLGFEPLGWVIMASAACFSLSEWQLWRQVRDHLRDVGDLHQEGRWESEVISQRQAQQTTASDPITTGIDGLEAAINRREGKGSAGGAL